MTFHLESLTFDTIFDQPVDAVTVPCELQTIPAAFFITEGIVSPSKLFARIRGSRVTLAMRMEQPRTDVRLTIPFIADDHALRLLGRPDDDDLDDVDDYGRHRTFQVVVQGRPRAVGVLMREGEEDTHRQVIQVDVSPDDIGPEGVLFVDIDPLEVSMSRVQPFVDPLVGLGISRVKLDDQPPKPLLPSVAGVRRRDGYQYVPPGLDFFAVNPGAGEGPVTLTLQSIAAAPHFSARVRSRIGRELVRRLRVETMTVRGERASLAAERVGPGRWSLDLPMTDEPILVRPMAAGPWRVELDQRG